MLTELTKSTDLGEARITVHLPSAEMYTKGGHNEVEINIKYRLPTRHVATGSIVGEDTPAYQRVTNFHTSTLGRSDVYPGYVSTCLIVIATG